MYHFQPYFYGGLKMPKWKNIKGIVKKKLSIHWFMKCQINWYFPLICICIYLLLFHFNYLLFPIISYKSNLLIYLLWNVFIYLFISAIFCLCICPQWFPQTFLCYISFTFTFAGGAGGTRRNRQRKIEAVRDVIYINNELHSDWFIDFSIFGPPYMSALFSCEEKSVFQTALADC